MNSIEKKAAYLLLIAVVLLSSCSGGGWRQVRSVEGGFSVDMPAKPEIQTQERPTIYGIIHAFIYLADGADAQYLLNYADYPPGLVGESTPDIILDGAILGLVGDTGGTLQTVEKIELQGYPGREVLLAAPDGASGMRVRIFLVGERLYQLLVLSAADKDVSEDTARYFNSLEFFPFPPRATEAAN